MKVMRKEIRNLGFISLYDHLGEAAGRELGKQVAEYAKLRNVKFGTKNVSNSSYDGIVLTYTPEFLNEFFKVKEVFTNA